MAEEDIMWGKKRHLYGGIEPSNMLEFKALYDPPGSDFVKIIATLPNDTIIDGQMICSVGGAMIRRKLTGYPVDEFDGEEVYDIKNSTEFIDMETEANGTYFYAAFPYSTQGVYNRSVANRASVNEPGDMVVFRAERSFSTEVGISIKLTYTLPEGVAGAYICKSTATYPTNEQINQLLNVTESGVYLDSDVTEGVTYYYTAFPYSNTGIVNRNTVNRSSNTPIRVGYIFGYDLDTTDSNPATRVTYPDGVDNTDYTPAGLISSNVFTYGSWPSTPGEKFMPKPCTIKLSTGEVYEYLNPDNYKKNVSGATSKVTDKTYASMMEWPKIYTYREEVDGVYKFRCSDTKIDDRWECWCNYDKNNNVIDHFYTSIYLCSTSSSKAASFSGNTNVLDYVSSEQAITFSRALGDGWNTETISDRLLIQDLLVMMAKTTDGGTAYGYGRGVSSSNKSLASGHGDDVGMFYGSTNSFASKLKVFGMEYWWSNVNRCVSGFVINNGVPSIKITEGTYDGSTSKEYSELGTGYVSLGDEIGTYNKDGYISGMKTFHYGRIPYALDGSSTTYECDSMLFSGFTGVCCAKVGGGYTKASECGPFTIWMSELSSTSVSGFALSYKPVKEVS